MLFVNTKDEKVYSLEEYIIHCIDVAMKKHERKNKVGFALTTEESLGLLILEMEKQKKNFKILSTKGK